MAKYLDHTRVLLLRGKGIAEAIGRGAVQAEPKSK